MNNIDAKIVAEVLSTADGDCVACAYDLAKKMQKYYYEYDWIKLVRDAGNWNDPLYDRNFSS